MVAETAPRTRARGLRARVLTALFLGPTVMLAVLLLPTGWFGGMMALFIGLAAWEWSALAGFDVPVARAAYAAAALACLLVVWLLEPRTLDILLLAFAALWWIVLSVRLFLIRRIDTATGHEPSLLLIGLLVLIAPWLALMELHASSTNGPFLALSLLLLIWFADTAAYFAGRRFGRAKLSALLSPGKTWVGVYAGIAAAALWGGLVALLLGLTLAKALIFVALCVVTAMMSVIGDLFESLLKRRRSIKDAGSLLPGHGGLLDRIDSATAAAPIFTLGLLWLVGGQ
jgi:phosphatidate cytidylyltransferase